MNNAVFVIGIRVCMYFLLFPLFPLFSCRGAVPEKDTQLTPAKQVPRKPLALDRLLELSDNSFEPNFSHLDFLSQTLVLKGQLAKIVYPYADYKNGRFVRVGADGNEDTKVPVEGISCLDDVARAISLESLYLMYSKGLDPFGREKFIASIKQYLNFVFYVYDDRNKCFYNFIYKDLQLNTKGSSSVCDSRSFWNARAIKALADSLEVLDKSSPEAIKVRDILSKFIIRVDPSKISSDSLAILHLGMLRFHKHDPQYFKNIRAQSLLDNSLHALCKSLKIEGVWNSWGSRQIEAIMSSVGVVEIPVDCRESMKNIVDNLYARIVLTVPFVKIDFKNHVTDPTQIAYSVASVARSLLVYGQVTKQVEYRKLAGLSASWLYGNNLAGAPMYDESVGSVYDGIDYDRSANTFVVNRNSGAESTIEGLEILMYVKMDAEARRFLHAKNTYYRVDSDLAQIKHDPKSLALNWFGASAFTLFFENAPVGNYPYSGKNL